MANQYNNKVVLADGTTILDISTDTVTANTLLSGSTAHAADGSSISGAVQFVTYYTGSSAPSSSLGNNGDIYLRVT